MPSEPSHPAPYEPDGGDAEEMALVQAIQRDGPSNAAAWTSLLKRYQDRLYAVCLRMVNNPDAAADLTQDSMVKIIQGLSGYDGRAKLSTWMIRITMNTCLSHLRSQKLRRHASLDSLLDETDDARGRGAGGGTPAGALNHRAAPPAPQSVAGRIGPESATIRSEKEGIGGDTADIDTAAEASTASPTAFIGARGRETGDWREQSREHSPHEGVELEERRRLVAAALVSLPQDQRAILVLRDVQDLDYDQIAEVMNLAVGTVKSRLFRARAALREAVETSERTAANQADKPPVSRP